MPDKNACSNDHAGDAVENVVTYETDSQDSQSPAKTSETPNTASNVQEGWMWSSGQDNAVIGCLMLVKTTEVAWQWLSEHDGTVTCLCVESLPEAKIITVARTRRCINRQDENIQEEAETSEPNETSETDEPTFAKKQPYLGSLKILSLPLLTREEEIALSRKIRKGDHRAEQLMVESNMRLVVRIAAAFANHGVDIEDLICEGNRGLMKAAKKYRPESKKANKARFSTYAAWWIKQAMRRAIIAARIVRYPNHMHDKFIKFMRHKNKLEKDEGHAASAADIVIASETSDATSLDLKSVKYFIENPQSMVSLDSSSGTDDDRSFYDRGDRGDYQDPSTSMCHNETITHAVQMDETRQILADAVLTLTEREAQIINVRFGLQGNDPTTLEEMGTRLKLSRERIRQLEVIGIGKIKDYLVNHGVSECIKSLFMQASRS